MIGYTVQKIDYSQTKPFILNIHYAHRMPSVSYAYGLFRINDLVGIITYGKPVSNNLCYGICGHEHSSNVIELNRLVLRDNIKNEASFLISQSLQMLPKPKIVVSYADTAQDHVGMVYQASNFIFTGTTKLRTEMRRENGGHSRHGTDTSCRQVRSPKHRYVYLVGDKRQKRILLKALRYSIYDYPKKANS
jgi:hypothetical protein